MIEYQFVREPFETFLPRVHELAKQGYTVHSWQYIPGTDIILALIERPVPPQEESETEEPLYVPSLEDSFAKNVFRRLRNGELEQEIAQKWGEGMPFFSMTAQERERAIARFFRAFAHFLEKSSGLQKGVIKRARNSLVRAAICTFEDFNKVLEGDLDHNSIRGLGPGGIHLIRLVLAQKDI